MPFIVTTSFPFTVHLTVYISQQTRSRQGRVLIALYRPGSRCALSRLPREKHSQDAQQRSWGSVMWAHSIPLWLAPFSFAFLFHPYSQLLYPRGEGQGSLSSCSSWGWQRVGYERATELTELICSIMSSVNSVSFTSSFLLWFFKIYFSCLIVVARTFSTMLHESNMTAHLCLIPVLTGNAFRFFFHWG